jgi:Glycosyltransferase family 87
MRPALTVAALIVLLAAGGYQLRTLLADPALFPPDDFIEYWAAGRLNLQGENPYDPAKLLPLQQAHGGTHDYAIMMWNPPWTLSLAMPFGALPVRASQFLWVGLNLLLILGSIDLLWRFFDGDLSRRWLGWLLGMAFFPTLILLKGGQIGGFFLLGATLFLVFERRGWPILAGAVCALMAVKPHLMYLFWPALAGWVVVRLKWNRWGIIVGGIFAGLALSAAPLAFNRDVFSHYFEALTQRPPDNWRTPTLGTLLRMIFGEEHFRLQFIPPIFGFGWFLYDVWSKRHRTWVWGDRLPMLLMVSFITTPYGAWPYDLVLLYPAIVSVIIRLDRERNRRKIAFAVAVLVVLQSAALYINLNDIGSEWIVWFAPTLLIATMILQRPPAAP